MSTKPKQAKRTKRFLTLIEIMIVLALLSMIAGVGGISLNNALKQQRFYQETQKYLSLLQRAQELMMVENTSFKVAVQEVNGELEASLFATGPVSKTTDKWLQENNKVALPHIKEAVFREPLGVIYRNRFAIEFGSKGFVMQKGSVELYSKGDEKREIFLQGFPESIAFDKRPPETAQEALLAEQLTLMTRLETLPSENTETPANPS